jgi:PST family polysaccharide transporter
MSEPVGVVRNAVALSVVQVANYAFPLLTFPYLTRTLSTEIFGMVAVVTAVSAYFMMVSDYGFGLTATRDVAAARSDPQRVAVLMSAVFGAKLVLLAASVLILALGLLLTRASSIVVGLHVLAFLGVVGYALTPTWYFHGMEQMAWVTYPTVVAKGLLAAATFWWVRGDADVIRLLSLQALSALVVAAFGLLAMRRHVVISAPWPTISSIRRCMADATSVFVSRVLVTLYSSSGVLVLGLVSDLSAVGAYAIAEKASSALSSIYGPILQALFPSLARDYHDRPEVFHSRFRRSTRLLLLSSVFLAVAVAVAAPLISRAIRGAPDPEVAALLRVLALAIAVAPAGPSFTNYLVIVGRQRAVTHAVFAAAVVNLLLVVPLVVVYQASGLAWTVVLVQFFVAAAVRYRARTRVKGLPV